MRAGAGRGAVWVDRSGGQAGRKQTSNTKRHEGRGAQAHRHRRPAAAQHTSASQYHGAATQQPAQGGRRLLLGAAINWGAH